MTPTTKAGRALEGNTPAEQEFWDRLAGMDADSIDWMNFRRILNEIKAEAVALDVDALAEALRKSNDPRLEIEEDVEWYAAKAELIAAAYAAALARRSA